jgi:ribosomal-protein-alanine N-acetyltransferase
MPYVLAVVLKETGELIGDTGVNEVEGKTEEVEIGFVISREYRGKGYASEVIKRMTDYIIHSFGIKVLYGRVMKGNEASVRVLEKNGYNFVGEEYGAEDDPYGNGMLIYKKE